jgi:hypothetical protein
MVVRYDHEINGFVVEPDECGGCGEPLYDSGCAAPGCNGRACQDCGTGCDLDFVDADEGGRCAAAIAEEDEDERDARIDAERAAFGLSPLTGRG